MTRAVSEKSENLVPAAPGEQSPGASPLREAAAGSPETAISAPAGERSHRAIVGAFVAGFVVATIIFAVLAPFPHEGSPSRAGRLYQQIRLGMTRSEVKHLMRPSSAMYTTIESTDIIILDERFMIAVTYGPKPPRPPQVGTMLTQPPDHWIVKEKIYVDHKRSTRLEEVMASLGLWNLRTRSDRVFEEAKPDGPAR